MQNMMRREAMRAGSARSPARSAIVLSYDPNNYCCKVKFQPDGNESGWIPVSSPWIGAGWGIVCPPSVGDAVQVEFQEGDAGAGYIVARFFNDVDKPPGACPSGEFWLVHKSGSFLKFTNDGNVSLKTTTYAIDAANVTVTGNITAQGNITAVGTLTGGGVNMNTHTHGGIQPGGGNTGGPHN
jgi:phage baseplate assembly protein gpV